MKKKVIITGGAGFIGSNLAIKLKTKGYNVTILDNMSQQIHGKDYKKSYLYNNIKDEVNFILGDIRDKTKWKKALEDANIIVHLAAETGTGQSMYEIQKYTDVNLKGTSVLLDLLANNEHNIEKIIFASSRAIYGEGKYVCDNHGVVYPDARENKDMKKGDFHVKCPICKENVNVLPTSEDSKIHPTSIYGFTKKSQEELFMLAGKFLNIPVVGFRYQNVYGPGQSLKNPYTGILSIFSTRIKNGNKINIFEDGKESRDFVYIDDVVNATILGIEREKANFEVFNVGSGELTDVLTVANTLKEKYDSDVEIEISGNYRLGDIRHNYADLSKIKNTLGFEPKVDFDEGITNFINWVNEQNVEEDKYKDSLNEMKQRGLYK